MGLRLLGWVPQLLHVLDGNVFISKHPDMIFYIFLLDFDIFVQGGTVQSEKFFIFYGFSENWHPLPWQR